MSSAHGCLEGTTFDDPVTRRRTTVVQFGGWTVDIDGAAVTVPRQDITGKTIHDLAICLNEAYTRAGVRITSGPPTYGPEVVDAVIGTLRLARQIAKKHWQSRSYDLYRCTRDAWENTGLVAPYTLIIVVLRAALPAATTLIEYNDRANGTQICGLYDRAIALLRRSSAGKRGVA
ncbi:MAG TPA: hypothetical protein VEF72_16865 [Mycobacterium sp.]|nr:hypothetical protein [Mycobacterium sp.]